MPRTNGGWSGAFCASGHTCKGARAWPDLRGPPPQLVPCEAGLFSGYVLLRPAPTHGAKWVEHCRWWSARCWGCHSIVRPAFDRWTFRFWFPLSSGTCWRSISSLGPPIADKCFIHRTRTFIYDTPSSACAAIADVSGCVSQVSFLLSLVSFFDQKV